MAQGKDLGALIGQIGADIREWEKAAMTMQKDLDKIERRGDKMARGLAKSLDNAGKKMQQTGKRMTMSISAPLLAMGGLAVREFGKFDASMTKSIAIMGDVSDTMQDQMASTAREVGRTMSLSAEEAADSYFYLASAGLNAEQSVAALPQVAEFAQAGMFDMATATDLATDAQSALGLTVQNTQKNLSNLTRVTDVLVKANTLANATVEQFSTSLTREAGSALKSMNKDIEEGVAVLAAFADQGIKGERAGMGLSRIIRLMTQAANNNKEAMDRLGLSVFDSEGNMRNLADIIGNLETAFQGMSDQQRTAALESIGFTARVQGMILPLLGTSDAIREYEGELRTAAGTTKEISENQMDAFNEQLSLLVDNFKDVGIEFGKTLEPAIRAAVKWTQGLVKSLQEMNDTTRTFVVVLSGIAIAAGPVIWALGSMARALSSLILFLPKVTKAFGALNLMMKSNPWILAATAIGSLAAILAGNYLSSTEDAIEITNDFEKAIDDSTKSVREASTALDDMSFAQMFNTTNNAIDNTRQKLGGLEDDLRETFNESGSGGADMGRSFREWLEFVEDYRPKAKKFLRLDEELAELLEYKTLMKDLVELENERREHMALTNSASEWAANKAEEMVQKKEDQIDTILTQLGLSTRYTEQEEETNEEIEKGNEKLKTRKGLLDSMKFSDMALDIAPIELLDQALMGVPFSINEVDQALSTLEERLKDVKTGPQRKELDALIAKLEELKSSMTGDTDSEGDGEDNGGPPVFEEMSQGLQALTRISDQFTSSFGQGISNIVVEGEKLADVLDNIGKLLLSSAIQTGLSLLLSGGLSGGGFFGKDGGIFGALFGTITDVDDALIQPNGNVVKFHPRDTILAAKDMDGVLSGYNPTSGNSNKKQVLRPVVVQLDRRTIYKAMINEAEDEDR